MLTYSTINFKGEFQSEFLEEKVVNLLDKTFVIPESYSYNVFEVTEEYIARPDLISYDAYGDSMFGDIICKINGVSNPFELNKGMMLIIPSPENILDFAVRPNVSERDDAWGVVAGHTAGKTKQSKRQANEALVGDTRFKVDAASGIIIY